MGAEDCGSAGDESRPLRSFPSGDKALAVWTLGNFKLSTNQSDSQTTNPSTPLRVNQPTGHSVSRLNLKTPHALANRSGISASLSRSADTKVYLSRPPSSTPTSPKDISPRSRPTESGSARAYPASASLRRFPIHSFSGRGKSAFFIISIYLIGVFVF